MKMDHAKVLIVEDDFVLMQALDNVLRTHGFDVQFCVNAETGLSLARSWQPDIILLDVRLPERNGLAMLADLKKTPDTVAIPVLIMTGYPNEEDRRIATFLGAKAYLAKPLSPEALLGIVEKQLMTTAVLSKLGDMGMR
ncbi:MAG: response regulator [Verrucomicrobia bacterium]|nr:response regulator [Verrucomicrobiota bacterium]